MIEWTEYTIDLTELTRLKRDHRSPAEIESGRDPWMRRLAHARECALTPTPLWCRIKRYARAWYERHVCADYPFEGEM